MKDFRGETTSEDRMIRAMQKAIGAQENGWVGAQTMSDLAVAVNADCWPCTLRLYDMPVIIADDVIVSNPKAGCRSFTNSMSGQLQLSAEAVLYPGKQRQCPMRICLPCVVGQAGERTVPAE